MSRSVDVSAWLMKVVCIGSLVIFSAGCGGSEKSGGSEKKHPQAATKPAESNSNDEAAARSVAQTDKENAKKAAAAAPAYQSAGKKAAATETNESESESAAAVASTKGGESPDRPAAPSTPQPAEPEPAAEPQVTIDPNPGPPATVDQAAKLLDLRTFPVLEDSHIPGPRRSIGQLHYSTREELPAAFQFQRDELKKRGWQELPGARETGENPAAHFTQEGFLVYVSVSSFGRGPNGEEGWTSVSIGNHGNVPVDKLPVPEGVEPFYPMPGQASYVTQAPLEEAAPQCKQLLEEAGWQPYGKHVSESPVSNSYSYQFKQNAVRLTAHISDHSAQPGKTFIRYSCEQLTADIPAPKGVSDFRYTESDKTLRFQTKDPAQDVAAHYVQELGKRRWKPTTDKPVVDQRDAMMVFRNEAGDRIDLDMTVFDDLTRVSVKHLTPADIAEIDKQIEALAEKREMEAAEREKAETARKSKLTYAFPIPPQAKKFELDDDGGGLEITLPGGSGPAVLTALSKHFQDAGWTEKSLSTEGPAGSLRVRRGDSMLLINYINIDKTADFELSVNCFSAYLKPVQKKEK